MKKKIYRPRRAYHSGFHLVIPFFVTLGVLTAVSFAIPLRPTQSSIEKRNLAEFPDFSVDALISGSYFDDITTWYSDTFPGREGWIALSSRISDLHGRSDVTIQGDIPLPDVTPEVPQATEIPEPTRPAETVPPETRETTPIPTDPPKEIELGAVIQMGDAAYNYQGFSQIYSDAYARILNSLSDLVKDTGARVVSAPAPTAVGIMVDPSYLEALNCAPQDEIIAYMHGGLNEDVVPVDTYSAMIDHNDEYLYFRTDHHWTALGAYYAYTGICEALDYEPAPLDSFEVWDQGEFEGSIYWKASHPRKLKLDTVYAYIPQGDITHRVYGNEMSSGMEKPLLDDMTKRDKNTKYLTFICSDNPLSVITNESIPDAPNCILVKDSFGNALAPFLTQNYHKVFVVDYRKFYAQKLFYMVKEQNIRDVIISPYLTATQSDQGTGLLRSLCNW